MMSDETDNAPIPIRPAKLLANPQIVALLEKMLEDARAGHIQAICGCSIGRADWSLVAAGDSPVSTMVGLLEIAKHSLISSSARD
jgi:hypothetical protein